MLSRSKMFVRLLNTSMKCVVWCKDLINLCSHRCCRTFWWVYFYKSYLTGFIYFSTCEHLLVSHRGSIESAKWRAQRVHVHYVPYIPRCLTCPTCPVCPMYPRAQVYFTDRKIKNIGFNEIKWKFVHSCFHVTIIRTGITCKKIPL